MVKRKATEWYTMIYRYNTLYWKLKIEQHEPRKKTEGQTVPAPLATHIMLFKFHDTVYEDKNSTK